jgi:hypothetical protein
MSLNTIMQTFDGVAVHHMQCWCGVSFAIPTTLYNHYLRENEAKRTYSLYCPLGHSMIPAGQSEADRLRDRLSTEKYLREMAEIRAKDARLDLERKTRQVNGYKGVVTRMKRRAVAGRCPCCSHAFKDLERHMKAKHPKFDPDRAAEALSESSK